MSGCWEVWIRAWVDSEWRKERIILGRIGKPK
jgi:hypothetical protein